MATATKSRRVLATPAKTPAKTPRKHVASQQAVLDNFDLEVAHRKRDFSDKLDASLQSFLALVDAEVLRIPRALREMTLGELESCWAGGFAETSRALAERRFADQHPDKDEAGYLAAAKRKRDLEMESPLSTSPRSSKTARKVATPAAKRRPASKSKRTKPVLPAAAGTSTLPQDYVFNPLLPKTPKHPRAPRRNESFFSENGSPVDLGAAPPTSEPSPEPDSDDDELPDPEALERAALRASMREGNSSSTRSYVTAQSHAHTPLSKPAASRAASRAKRPPSLIFRQSIGGTLEPAPGMDDQPLAHVALSNGHTISFNPFDLDPTRIDAELAQGPFGEAEKKRVKELVQEEVVKALTEQMSKWRALK